MHDIDFEDCICIFVSSLSNAVYPWICVMFCVFPIFMAPMVGRKFKTKAKKVSKSTFAPVIEFDHIRFPNSKNEKLFETLIKYRSIWGERQVNLDELDPSICRNLQYRNRLSLCSNFVCPPADLIREFYVNLSIHCDDSGGHYFTTWIRGEEFQITKKVVFDTLILPLVHRPTFPYIDSPFIDDVMTLLCGRLVTWGSNPRINSSELTKLSYIFFKIACHNIFPIAHIHTFPIERCVFLYALITNSSIFFPSLFI